MTVDSFVEYDNEYQIILKVNGCEESTRLVRMLIQGKIDGAHIAGEFFKEKNAELWINIPKNRKRRFNSTIKLGAQKIR
jgi:hypothetical protein